MSLGRQVTQLPVGMQEPSLESDQVKKSMNEVSRADSGQESPGF